MVEETQCWLWYHTNNNNNNMMLLFWSCVDAPRVDVHGLGPCLQAVHGHDLAVTAAVHGFSEPSIQGTVRLFCSVLSCTFGSVVCTRLGQPTMACAV
jgi:hypothetical protein